MTWPTKSETAAHERRVERAASQLEGRTPDSLADELLDCMCRMRPLREGSAARHAVELAFEAAQLRMAKDFGAGRGWTLRGRHLGVDMRIWGSVQSSVNTLFGNDYLFDHAYTFYLAKQSVALVCHLYDFGLEKRRKCEEIAHRFGVDFEAPEFPSWWYPRHATLVVYSWAPGHLPRLRRLIKIDASC